MATHSNVEGTIIHKVSSEISTVEADSLEKLLAPNDTLWIKADDGLASLGSGLSFETDSLTLILDADADRDGTGTLTSGFTVKSTGTNTQVRVLMGKNSNVDGAVTTPYHSENFLLFPIGPNPSRVFSYTFDMSADAWLEFLYLLNNRSDMNALGAVLAANNGPLVNEFYINSSYCKGLRHGYALGQDIDLGTTPSSPMAKPAQPFRAILDGMHHTIKNLSITSSADNIGLFAATKFATIRNTDFANISIIGKDSVGAVAGIIDSLTQIQNIRVLNGTISGNEYVAGLVGISLNQSSISYVLNQAAITGSASAAGIVGHNYAALSHLENRGPVTSTTGSAAGIAIMNGASENFDYTVNYGTITGRYAAGILASSRNTDSLRYTYNYGAIEGEDEAAGLVISSNALIRAALNNAVIQSSRGNAGGIRSSISSGGNNEVVANTGYVFGKRNASAVYGVLSVLRNFMNTGKIESTSGYASGACYFSNSTRYALVSAEIKGIDAAHSEVAATYQNSSDPPISVYNTSLAINVKNMLNYSTPLDHSTIRDFANYPERDSFIVFWHAPTSFTLPTPMNVFPDGQVYKKLRQDALVRATTDAFSMDSIHTYLPTYGNDWTYSCKARNGLATCAVSAQATTITQAYNVTGAETIVFEATHASGLVVRDSLQVQYNVERKSAPKLSAAWPADTVVTEGAPVVLDLGQYFTDADGESITYTLSKTSVVYSELNGDVLTLCYDKKVGKETFTVYATDAGGRKSPVASLAVTVSTLPGVLKALPVLVLKTDSVLTLDLDDYFWDADDDVLGYTVTEPKNNDVVLKGSILQIAMTSLRPDSLVITVADDDKHVLLAWLKLVNSASTVLAVHPEQRLGLELAGNLLRLTSTESATAWLRILDLQGGLRYETTLDLAVGTNALALPALPPGAYRIHVRQGDNLRILGWEKR